MFLGRAEKYGPVTLSAWESCVMLVTIPDSELELETVATSTYFCTY